MLKTETVHEHSLAKAPVDYDPYVCSLSPKMKAVAKEELREDENIRTQALAQFREWISKHPHIKRCRTDAVFLLRFLRTKKFSVPAACDMLERYLTVRQLYPQWFKKLDIEDKDLLAIIDSGYLIPLIERDQHGRVIIMSLPIKFDTHRFTSMHLSRAHSLVSEAYMDDEDCQVAGYTYINDEDGINMSFVSMWSFVDLKTVLKCVQNSAPMRHKETHFLNIPSFANKLIEFALSMLSDKLKKRTMFHKSIPELHAKIDPKILPKEYGGVVPASEMVAAMKERLQKKRAAILALDDMYIEITKESANFASTDDADIDAGMVGSFRKLEVD